MWLPGSALEEPGIEEVARIVAQLGAACRRHASLRARTPTLAARH